MVTEVRNIDTRSGCGLHDRLARLKGKLDPIDGQRLLIHAMTLSE